MIPNALRNRANHDMFSGVKRTAGPLATSPAVLTKEPVREVRMARDFIARNPYARKPSVSGGEL